MWGKIHLFRSLKNQACVQQRQFIIIARINQLNNANNEDVISICYADGIKKHTHTHTLPCKVQQSLHKWINEFITQWIAPGRNFCVVSFLFLLAWQINECVWLFILVKLAECHTEYMVRVCHSSNIVCYCFWSQSWLHQFRLQRDSKIYSEHSLFCFKLPLTSNPGE